MLVVYIAFIIDTTDCPCEEHLVECAVNISGYHFNPYTDYFYLCIVNNRFQLSDRNPGYRDFLIECNCFFNASLDNLFGRYFMLITSYS